MTKHLFIKSYNRQLKGHCHSYDQITIPLLGCIDMIMDGKALSVSYGEAVYIPKNTYHYFQAQEDFRFLVADIPQSNNNHLNRRHSVLAAYNQDNQSLSIINKTLKFKPRIRGFGRSLYFKLDEKTLLFTEVIDK